MRMKMTKETDVIVLTTGGTIEKTYDESEGTLHNRETVIKNRILEKLRLPYTRIEVHALMAKDSLEMDDADREKIFLSLQNYLKQDKPIVVLHGTDTMEVTAKYCFDRIQDLKVPIVFTGAMKPLGFDDSDALQNVVEALFAAKLVKVGIYISFHNQLFDVPFVTKNREKRTFQTTKK
jgi:L-asparaginase